MTSSSSTSEVLRTSSSKNVRAPTKALVTLTRLSRCPVVQTIPALGRRPARQMGGDDVGHDGFARAHRGHRRCAKTEDPDGPGEGAGEGEAEEGGGEGCFGRAPVAQPWGSGSRVWPPRADVRGVKGGGDNSGVVARREAASCGVEKGTCVGAGAG